MNKKVITFLSLFSLVLILSIYYVISPFGESNTPIDNNVNVNINLKLKLYAFINIILTYKF